MTLARADLDRPTATTATPLSLCSANTEDLTVQNVQCASLRLSDIATDMHTASRALESPPRRGSLLIVARDEPLASELCTTAQRYTVTKRVRTAGEALGALNANTAWSGIVLELEALECEPLGIVRLLREAHPLLPLLVVTKQANAERVNALHALRCELVLMPVATSNLASFVARALVFGRVPDERVAACVNEIARERSLTCREVQLMAYGLGGDSRAQIMRQLSITENTLKTQVRGLLRKCGAHSMDALVNMVLRRALVMQSLQHEQL